MKEDSEL